MGILHRHRRPHRAVRAGTLLLLIVLLYGCGGGGSNTTNSTPTPTTTTSTTTTVDGMVSKGPLAGATITIFTLLPNGQRGSQVAPGAGQPAIVTQANGAWTATIPSNAAGPFLVVATGGAFFDEVTGTSVPIGISTDLLGLLPAGATTAAITPVTHALAVATQTALQTVAATGTSPDVNATVTTAITNATETFGFDPVRTLPPDPRALTGQSTEAIQYAAVLGGISQLLADARSREAAGQEPTLDTGTLLVALAQDLTDGVIDGKQAGQPITAPNGQVIPSLIPTSQTTTLADVANTFAMNPPTTTGLDRATLQTTITSAPVVIVPPPGGDLTTPQTTPANKAPVPTAPALTTLQNTAGTSQVSPNDPDAGESFSFRVSTPPAHGTATVNTSGLTTYTPDAGFTGTDSFVVTVTDNGTPPLAGTVTIAVTVTAPPSITPPNIAPAPTAPALSLLRDTPGTSQVSPNDPDAGESFTFSVSILPVHGTAAVDEVSGLATYTPEPGYTGPDSFVVTVTDNGTPPLTGTVTITVTVTAPPNTAPPNSPPTVTSCGTTRTIIQGNSTSLNVTASDPDGDPLRFAWQQTTPATPTGVFSAPTAAATTWTAPGVAADTSFTLQVTVTDLQGAAVVCQVSVTVKKTFAFILDVSALDDDTQRLQ